MIRLRTVLPQLMPSGLVSHIQKYSIHDGPGIRTTVFLKGCPLHCAWCHNPENISPQPEVLSLETRCVHCGECARICPQKGTYPSDRTAASDQGLERTANPVLTPHQHSTPCGTCGEACPTGARVLMGRQMTVSEVMDEILADRLFYDGSKGGVTFSGGEPLLQFEFLQALLESCRAHGVDTTVDTCGFAPREHLLAVAPLTGLFLYDLKLLDEARHREFTGVSNALILENLQALARVHRAIWIRVPLIPTVNDSPAEIEAMARFVASMPAVRQVNILPYHRTGIHKFSRLGQEYRLKDLVPPSPAQLQAVTAQFTARGLVARAGG